jgi:hypothetical protein
MKKSLSFGAVAIVLLLVAGVSYWAIRETSQPTSPSKSVAEAPAPPFQSPPPVESSPSVGQGNSTMGSPSPQSTAPPASAAPAAPPSSSATAPNQPTGPTASNQSSNLSPLQPSQAPGQSASPPTASSNPEPPAQPSQATSPSPPPSAAVAASMPSEDKMSVANRRQVQEALHRLDYYHGPVDGIFGPLTRAAIRRFQESIGEKSTGHLTAAEASRLVSTS